MPKDKIIVVTGHTMSKLEKEEFSKLMNVGSVIVADERNGYLAGVDILVDGRSVNAKEFIK